MKLEQIFEQAKDLHVVATKVFAKASDTKAYKDAAYTEQFTTSELTEAFIKGALVISGDNMYQPAGLVVASSVATLSYVTVSGTTATGATLVSKADAAE